jgi:outer membrane protein assembly factor BamB
LRTPTGFPESLRRRPTASPLGLILIGAALLSAAFGLSSAAAQPASEPWSQTQGGPAHGGFVPEGPQPPYREAWRVEEPAGGPTNQFGISAPVLTGRLAIAVGPENVLAVDVATGESAWTIDREFGPPVAPAVVEAGGRTLVLYSEGFGDSPPTATPTPTPTSTSSPSPSAGPENAFPSFLVAIDLETRQAAWDAPVELKEVSRTGVTVDGDTAYVGDDRGNVYAIDAITGDPRWTADAGGFIDTSVAVSDGLVVVVVQGNRSARASLVALDGATGEQRWRRELEGVAVLGSMASIADGIIYAGFSDRTVRAFRLTSGAQLWSARVNGFAFVGSPAVVDGAVVVVDSGGQVYRLDATTGDRVWDFAVNEPVVRAPPLVIGDRALIATDEGNLIAIDMGSGRLVWQLGESDGLLRGLTPAGDLVLAVSGGERSGLVSFEHDPDGALVSLVSPTTLDLGRLLMSYGLAALPLVFLLFLGGRFLIGRLGPAFIEDDDLEDDDEEDVPEP